MARGVPPAPKVVDHQAGGTAHLQAVGHPAGRPTPKPRPKAKPAVRVLQKGGDVSASYTAKAANQLLNEINR